MASTFLNSEWQCLGQLAVPIPNDWFPESETRLMRGLGWLAHHTIQNLHFTQLLG